MGPKGEGVPSHPEEEEPSPIVTPEFMMKSRVRLVSGFSRNLWATVLVRGALERSILLDFVHFCG